MSLTYTESGIGVFHYGTFLLLSVASSLAIFKSICASTIAYVFQVYRCPVWTFSKFSLVPIGSFVCNQTNLQVLLCAAWAMSDQESMSTMGDDASDMECHRPGCLRRRILGKDGRQYLALCQYHYDKNQRSQQKNAGKRAERKIVYDRLIADQTYDATPPMPLYCKCSYKRLSDTDLEFEREPDGSWNWCCTICLVPKRQKNQERREEFKAAVASGKSTLRCKRCGRNKDRLKFTQPCQHGGNDIFLKCNRCSMKLCLEARLQYSDWKDELCQEIWDDYLKGGCCGPGNGSPCRFLKELKALMTLLSRREFDILFNYDL